MSFFCFNPASKLLLLAAMACAVFTPSERPVRAQIIEQAEQDPAAVRYGDAVATRYRVGAKVQAKGGPVQNIFIMVAVPLESAEQEVHVVEEDFSPLVE